MAKSFGIAQTTSDSETIFGPIKSGAGFHEIERDIWGPFVWTQKRFTFRRPQSCEFFVFQACYYGDRGKLSLKGQGGSLHIDLHRGWNRYPLVLSSLGSDITCEIDPLVRAGEDSRELGIMIRRFDVCPDASRMNSLHQALANKLLNEREYAEGHTTLTSYPTKLRINTATRCTMEPPCVYCDWSRTKQQERESGFATSLSALFEMGGFYRLADEVVDNSYGEPMLKDSIWDYVHEFERSLKYFRIRH